MAAFMAVAPLPLQWAFMLAADTGQRQGDLLRLPWSAYDGKWVKLTQSKTLRKVRVPVTARSRAVLSTIPRSGPIIPTNGRRRPWAPNAFRKAWGATTNKAGVAGLHFHDLRGTSVTRPSEAGCTPQEIARFTGHSLRDVAAILDRYLARTDKLASTALAKLERGQKVNADCKLAANRSRQSELSIGGHARNRTGVHGFVVRCRQVLAFAPQACGHCERVDFVLLPP